MNNARDELAGLLFTTDNSKSVSPWSEWERCKDDPRLAGYVYALAEAILAAGYSRPRTVRTVEELEGLPEGAVILDAGGDVCRSRGDGYWDSIAEPEEAFHYGDFDSALPASVLYEPEGK